MILETTVNLEDPEQLSKKLEAQRVRAAEKRDNEEDLDKYSTLGKFRVRRLMLRKMGWISGRALGSEDNMGDGGALRATEKTHHPGGG
eukprot:1689944-Pyramimonas_sp.AAC.1